MFSIIEGVVLGTATLKSGWPPVQRLKQGFRLRSCPVSRAPLAGSGFTATLNVSAALIGGEVTNILRGRAPAPSEAPRAEQGDAVADR